MKTVTDRDNIFRILDQEGPFATKDTAPDLHIFNSMSRQLARDLKQTGLRTRYRIIRDLVFQFLHIKSFTEIQRLIDDSQKRQHASERARSLLSNMFGIKTGGQDSLNALRNYSSIADGVVQYLKNFVFAPYSSFFEMTNKIRTINDPVELLLIPFDDRYHKKARFEARRKLVLVNLTAAIEQRERETQIEKKFSRFLDFLNAHVWSQEAKIGEREPALLLSQHSMEDFSCCDVSVLSWERIAAINELPPTPGMKRTLVKRLWFNADNKKIPIYVTVRKKGSVAKVLKIIRKGVENPDVAVDDELGLMGVLDTLADVRTFQKHLVDSAARAGSLLILEDISDTLEGGVHKSSSVGSSANTPMLKFFARMGGMRIEFIIHTNTSFLNYSYQKGVAHNEYEVRRLFDTGVAQLLFPKDIYLMDVGTIKNDLLQRFRQQIEAA